MIFRSEEVKNCAICGFKLKPTESVTCDFCQQDQTEERERIRELLAGDDVVEETPDMTPEEIDAHFAAYDPDEGDPEELDDHWKPHFADDGRDEPDFDPPGFE